MFSPKIEDNIIPNTYNIDAPRPCLFGNGEDHVKFVAPLYEASIRGDWETAKNLFTKRRDLVRCSLDDNLSTPLHVAVASRLCTVKSNFVKNLVNMMTNEELEIKNAYSCTAFWIAAASNNKHAVVIMMKKNSNLMNIRSSKDILPTTISARRWDQDLARYLYDCSQKMGSDHRWTYRDWDLTLLYCLESYNYDLALKILEDYPELARNVSLLDVLARDSYGFEREEKNLIARIIAATVRLFCPKEQHAVEEDSKALQILKKIWGHITKTMNISKIEDILKGPPTILDDGTIRYSSRIMFVAAEAGNTKFIVELLRTYPHLVLSKNDDGLTIFHIAVLRRHHDIYNLLYEMDRRSSHEIYTIKDKSGNNMLHLVGKSSKSMAAKTSASLLMQREVLWFTVYFFYVPKLRLSSNFN
ncbi:hypothetical protein QVD17_31424 [Tagetes erecta]|uniref:Uncharacterized protein n=1 Tax=Tagetes erecta TaxID=13708 RepID=A0AAD8NNH8_TARER|nr:hypothetical protein QVD17_31424 [Tagetes erecta]